MNYTVIMISFVGAAALPAAEIRWTAKGTVTALSGAAFGETEAAAGKPVEIEMTYDSDAQVSGRSYLPIGEAIAGRAWFYGEVGLTISVRIGAQTWTGGIQTIPNPNNAMESLCWDPAGEADWFRVTLDNTRGGTFPTFPHTGNQTARALILEFRDDIAPTDLFNVHALPDSVTNVCAMTSAQGEIQAGTSKIAFSIDPTSVHITQPRVPVSLSKTEDGISLRWETEFGKTYRIESSGDLRCWSSEGFQSGAGNPVERELTPFETFTRRFYRVVEM